MIFFLIVEFYEIYFLFYIYECDVDLGHISKLKSIYIEKKFLNSNKIQGIFNFMRSQSCCIKNFKYFLYLH